MPRVDPNSFANHDEARVTNFHLDLAVDFDRQVLSGHIDLDIEVVAEAGAATVVLDTRGLAVASAVNLADESAVEFKLDEAQAHEVFGTPLVLTLPEGATAKGAKSRVRLAYETSPDSAALQWLPPSQTAGKKHPYLFSQCQAIHARAMLPCQDSPGNKTPYTSSLTVPAPLVGLMSALRDGEGVPSADGKTIAYKFRQPVAMSSYLVAINVGAFVKRDIGPRSAVWSEAETIEAAAYEFADTEKFLDAAEKVAGPYEWGRYDLLVMPPSYPYGGMEHCCLTSVTPTLLAGDRSLANVVMHEAAHSWSGNWLSPENWESFWLNEGVCVFLERKIVRAVLGPKEQHLHAIIGLNALRGSVERYGADHAFTALHIKLDGVDPDDSFSSVPYEKGFNFLWYLEQLMGGDESLDDFLKEHFRQATFGNVTTEKFKAKFLEFFKGNPRLGEIDWDTWMYKPGMPPVANKFDTSLVDAATGLAAGLFDGSVKAADASVDGWSSNQVVVFLEEVQSLQKKADEAKRAELPALFDALDKALNLTASKNAEIRHRWYQIAIRAEMEEVFPAAAAFVVEQGRMKFTRTLYRDLFQSVKGKQLALDTFAANRQSYHNICQKMVAKDLGLE